MKIPETPPDIDEIFQEAISEPGELIKLYKWGQPTDL